jgi:sensor c-di-GMP phosphodiesterase-like protein
LKIPRHSVRDAALLILGGALGAAIALAGAHELEIRFAQEALHRYAQNVLRVEERTALELRVAILEFSSDSLGFCSPAELAQMRRFVYSATYIKDLGRVRDGSLFCMSGVGLLDKPLALPPPALSFNSADRSFRVDLTPHGKLALAPDSSGIIAIASGVSAVINPSLYEQLDNPPMQWTGLVLDRDHQIVARAFGNPLTLTTAEVLAGRPVVRGAIEYQPLCSPAYNVCVVAAESRHDMLTFHPGYFVSFSVTASVFCAAGALLGILAVATVLLFYHRQRSLERRFRMALRERELRFVYQPIVDLASGRIVAAEALARWTNSVGEEVPPDTFIRVAEDGGFIGEVTALAMEHALDELHGLLGQDGFYVTINISAADLRDPRFFSHLEQCLRKAGIPAAALGFELTEHSTALKDEARAAIARLRAAGHVVYLDDFGTGYSSLVYLHDLHADAIKIDRAFTQTIGTGAVTASVVPQILDMACGLDLRVIVEGIETAEQAAYFREACPGVLGQGFLLGVPLPAPEFLALCRSGGLFGQGAPEFQPPVGAAARPQL